MSMNEEAYNEMSEFLEGWTNDPQDMKGAFIRLKEKTAAALICMNTTKP